MNKGHKSNIEKMFFDLTILFLVITGIFTMWVRERYSFWTDRGFLQCKPIFPLGTLTGVGTKMTCAEKLNLYYKEFKGVVPAIGMYHFLSPVLLPIDPELVKNILVQDFEHFHSRGFFYNEKDDPVGVNILTLDGQEWRDRRYKLSPIFTSGKMRRMFDTINCNGDKMVDFILNKMSTTNDFEMRNWSQRFMSQNIGNVAFGIEPNSLKDENSEFTYYGKRLVEQSAYEGAKFMFSIEFPEVARKLHFGFSAKDASNFFLDTFIQTIETREGGHNNNKNDFVSLLLGLKEKYTKHQLAAEAFLIYFGGFETSSTLMTYTLYELALNLDIQARLREEIVTGIEENDGKLTYNLLFGFKYLDMIMHESLRKHPPIPTYFRKCTRDYKIPDTNLVIPAGCLVLINSFSYQRDPEYFPDPEKFDPERFNEDNVRNVSILTNLPFGNGPRKCLGKRFGLMQSKIGIVKLITNFVVSPTEKTQIPIKYNLMSPFLAPRGGMWLKLTKISK